MRTTTCVCGTETAAETLDGHGPLDLYLSRGFAGVAIDGNVVTVQKALTR